MGSYPRSDLVFGFPVELTDEQYEVRHYFAEQWRKAHPDAPVEPSGPQYTNNGFTPEFSAYREARDEWDSKYGIDVIRHGCFDNDEEFFLTISTHQVHGDWDSPEPVDMDKLQMPPDIDAMKKFCKMFDFEWQKPSWYLLSSHG